MNLDLADIGALLVVCAPFAILILRIFVIADGGSLDGLIVPRTDFEWPVGVEDEEPVHWRTDVLVPRNERPPARTMEPVAKPVPSRLRPPTRRETPVGDRASRTAV